MAQVDSIDINNEKEFRELLKELRKNENLEVSIFRKTGKLDENDNPNGLWTTYVDINRTKKLYEGEYVSGKRDGEWRMFDLSDNHGKIKCKEQWIQDTLKKWTCYSDPGKKQYEIETQNYIPLESLSSIQYLGSISSNYSLAIGNYYEGQKEILDLIGIELKNTFGNRLKLSFWSFKERIDQERYFDEGIEFKRVTYEYKNKELYEKKTYEYGELISKESNTSKFIGTRKIIYFNVNGDTKTSGFIDESNQEKEGNWFEYYLNGKKKSMGFYLDNQKHGVWKYWDEKGKLITKEKYKRGVLKK